MKKALFIDRDGTILVEPEDEQIDSWEKLVFLPGVISSLRRIATELDYELVMVTNQDGLGTNSFPEEDFWPVHEAMLNILAGESIRFAEILIDRTLPEMRAPTRKPGVAMMNRYLGGDYDMTLSFVIGDRETDVEFARNLGCRAIRVGEEGSSDPTVSAPRWEDIHRFLAGLPRAATAIRRTSETNITVSLSLDGGGESDIDTGIGFFDHMLEQLARHGGMDLRIQAAGDLHVDEHHTVEDTALTLGSALREALGSKQGIGRYAFLLPMDEASAKLTLDLSGRSHLEWSVEFGSERVGGLPTQMVRHFFRSLCDAAGLTLHVEARGENDHHVVEAIFKAFARCLREAATRVGGDLPSTKGAL